MNFYMAGWPDSVPGYGLMVCGAFDRCEVCPATAHPHVSGTWVRYGHTPICKAHAIKLAEAGAGVRPKAESA